MANVQDFDFVVCEFELQLRYYVHFSTNTLQKDMNRFLLKLWIK